MRIKLKFHYAIFYFLQLVSLALILLGLQSCESLLHSEAMDYWEEDFKHQPIVHRPHLEVRYTDASRKAFQILAEDYQLTGNLEAPHTLVNATDHQEWLWVEITGEDGQQYSTKLSTEPSRINLYRRGPYYCEVHWFDMQPTSRNGKMAPLKGDLTLFCYPDKILAEINWYATEDFPAVKLNIKGITDTTFQSAPFVKGTKQNFPFPLYGEVPPLPNEAFELLAGETPVYYDYRRGCYVVGTVTSDSFQKQFYEFPNRYETASFSLTNDTIPRKIYICHQSVVGGAIVEGGVLLDEEGHPMPIVVQVSKNFDGEKEEAFYNPLDTAFSETYFPLYLAPEESMTLSSLHVYQNWGRHMTKHWSSLGAWMDYFHSSTGVTETTCYVPFKFAGLGGVAIADFRAMSQETFWTGQPQHDNIAGHSFMSYYDGKQWNHAVYQGTTYRSTGPNWYDITLHYLSADSSIRLTVDIWESPQADELRSFFTATYEVLKPLTIREADVHFRFLTITSAIQKLRFTRFAATGVRDQSINLDEAPFPIRGMKLPAENAFIAEYGDKEKNRGSNAVIIRKFSAPDGIALSAGMQVGPYRERFSGDELPNTRLFLASASDLLTLQPGDVMVLDGFWLPYGPIENADTPRREVARYGTGTPSIVNITKGKVQSELPTRILAENNEAQFTLRGGKNLIPIIITGLSQWKNVRIWQNENGEWRHLSHARNTNKDGYQVFNAEDGSYGAVFLVYTNEEPQELRVTVEHEQDDKDRLKVNTNAEQVLFKWNNQEIALRYPKVSKAFATWNASEGGSFWFEEHLEGWNRGGRVSPNEEDIDLEYWWDRKEEISSTHEPAFMLDILSSNFSDSNNERTWVLTGHGWEKATQANMRDSKAIAVEAKDEEDAILALVWNNAQEIVQEDQTIGVKLIEKEYPVDRRYHVRGKVFLLEGDLEALEKRISRELNVLEDTTSP